MFHCKGLLKSWEPTGCCVIIIRFTLCDYGVLLHTFIYMYIVQYIYSDANVAYSLVLGLAL
jgi:hypothetical protein